MIYVFLPAYNEEEALPKLLKKFDEEFKAGSQAYRIVVVDDGSSDGTAARAEELSRHYPLELLKHTVNQGLGITMADGLRRVAEISSGDDTVVTMDCDDTHEPRYMHRAFEKLEEGYDLVILSRYQKGGGEEGLSTVRSLLSRGAGSLLKIFFPIRGVKEYSCGYRVFRASALKKAFEAYGRDFVRLPHMGFVVTPEILIKFHLLGMRIAEVPFVLNYGQKAGVSKNRPLKTIAGYFALIALYWGRKKPGKR